MKKVYWYNKDTLRFEKLQLWRYIVPIFVVVIVVVLSSFARTTDTIVRLVEGEKRIQLVVEDDFSEEAFIQEVGKYNFRYPDLIIAQARLESGNFTSPIFKEGNNLFGMKEAKSRLNVAKGTFRNHALYGSWQESLLDRALYEASYTHKIKDRKSYVAYLDRLYAEDGTYAAKLEKAVTKNKKKK